MPQTKARAATIQRSYQLLPVIGPSEGMDLRTSQSLMAPGRARELVNWSLSEPGALVVAPGFQKFSTSSLGNARAQGGARIYLNTATPSPVSTIFTLLGWNGGVYVSTDSGGWANSSNPVLAGLSTNEYAFPADRDLVAVFDGVNLPKKSTNGSSWTNMGIAAGSSASSLSSKSGGSFGTNEYEITYTYKARGLAFESNASTAHSTYTMGSTGAMEAQIPNSTDAQVDAIVVYARNKTSGETDRRRASSFAVQGGAHSTITLTSTNWSSNDVEPTNHNVPPVLSFGVVWKNRWWARSATVTNRLHFTELFLPQAWPSLFYIDIPFERGDSITALQPLGDALLIFGQTKVFVIIGQTSLDFEVRPTLGAQDGAFGFRSVTTIENGIVHAGASGIYIFDGTQDRLLSYDLDPAWQDLVGNTAVGDLAKIPMVYHQKLKELRVGVQRRYPTGTVGEWILDLNRTHTSQTPAWRDSDRSIGGYILWDGPESNAGDRGRLFSWNATTGTVFEEAKGTSGNSSNITAQYEGPGLTLGAFRGRWVDIRGEYEPNSGSLSVEAIVDGISQGTQSITIGTGLAVYDTAVYDTDAYAGAGRRQFHKMLPLSADGRTCVVKLVYAGQAQFRLFSYHAGINPESKSRDFSE